jgi:hypothetical protein
MKREEPKKNWSDMEGESARKMLMIVATQSQRKKCIELICFLKIVYTMWKTEAFFPNSIG